jgi:hypothetical protein
MHNAIHHNTLDDRQRRAILALGQSLGQLVRHRNAIEAARRTFIPVSKLDGRRKPSPTEQQGLFDATKDFYLSFYSAVSAFAGVVKRFQSIFGEVPHRSNERFLEWLRDFALFDEHWDTLRSARDFRTLIDHPASKQPFEWGLAEDGDGQLRAMLHGPAGQSGNIPDGAELLAATESTDEIALLPDDAWMFVAPDEDRVLTLLAVQLNAIVDRVQIEQFRADSVPCNFVPPNGDGDPDDGYPIFAIMAGEIIGSGPMTPILTPEDQARIDAILAPYIQRIRDGEHHP